MEVGEKVRVDGRIYTVLEIDRVEDMCRLLDEGNGEEIVEPLWSLV